MLAHESLSDVGMVPAVGRFFPIASVVLPLRSQIGHHCSHDFFFHLCAG